ncbi:hypothetical protein J3E68DRAFT_127160 [Trichoderma sp. SZMC 28012]
MTDEKKSFDFVCVDAASSTDGCPTPSTAMSEDMPIREKMEQTLKNDGDLSDSKPDEIGEVTPSRDNYNHHIEHHPIPGRLCMIRTRQKPHRILSLKWGKLEFRDHLSPAWGVYWSCSEKGNFLYLRNTTSGTYLGYLTSGGAGNIVMSQDYPEAKQNFIAIRQQSGGYVLHTLYPQNTELRQVVVKEDKNGFIPGEQDKGGTPLDFIDAKHVRYCVYLAIPNAEREALIWQD